MTKHVIFEPFSEDAGLLYEKPSPAAEHLPEWYKSMSLHLPGETTTGLSPDGVAVSNLTLKGCMPFLDAMTSGYMFTLPFDIEIRKNDNGQVGLRWATNQNLIGQHGPDQAPGLPIPQGASPNILKWSPGWRMITPPGYSCLFTHPLNRFDLPFATLSGVVDTDSYKLGVEFPFRLLDTNKDLVILEKGTPICQVIPFRRDDWSSSTTEFDEQENKKQGFLLKGKIIRSYQMQFWKKKSYK
jgi:hypothetical protein